MWDIGLPVGVRHTGGYAARCIPAPSGANHSELYTTASAQAAGSPTGPAARALCATRAKGSTRDAPTFGDNSAWLI